MNKELQDHVWKHCLPKEFKEEVKKEYKHQISIDNEQAYWMLERIFGRRNLTSGTEEDDEVLTVSRSKVQELYRKFKKDGSNTCLYAAATLDALFGSKCLPDEKDWTTCQDITCKNYDTVNGHCRFIEHCSYEPKPVEPKADKYFDTILKDGFRNERRLNIAATIMVGLLASCKDKYPIKRALELANALIAECEKKEGQDA